MSFVRSEIAFEAGLYANRSRHASKRRWVDGNLIRFKDGVPQQMGGWTSPIVNGASVVGAVRSMISWRANNQVGRFAAVGSEAGAWLYDGDKLDVITPTGFVPGRGTSVLGVGYGVGHYGAEAYGTPRTVGGDVIDASSWTWDLFGEVLLGCFSADGHIYDLDLATDTELQLVVDAPTARAICMSDERHLFAFGAEGIPGLVAWSDREDYTVWDPLATNRAGSYELQVRSPFQCGKRVRGSIIAWTKTEAFAFSPLQNALVYSRERISTEAGVVGAHAVAVVTDNLGETAYWFGQANFFVFDGLVRVLPCELHDYVFADINLLQGAKCQASINSAFDEVWFWYCSAAATEIDRAVVYNYAQGTWTKALISRLCWMDRGTFTKPLAFAASGILYEHESGDTADGDAIPSFVTSHPIMVAVGEQFAEVSEFWPDFQDGSAAAKVSFLCRNVFGGGAVTVGPFPVAIGQEFVPLAFTAREFQLRIDGDGGWWELGVPQITMQGGSLR